MDKDITGLVERLEYAEEYGMIAAVHTGRHVSYGDAASTIRALVAERDAMERCARAFEAGATKLQARAELAEAKLRAQAAEIGRAELPVKGCICPPTSEKTCHRWDCGRKSPMTITGFATTEMSIRDCEKSANGIGISGRECDCMEKPRDP